MDHIDLIEAIFIACHYNSYLELGIWNGENLAKMSKHAMYAVGVDIADVRDDTTTNLCQTTTDHFFEHNVDMFDLIFIDADHRYEQAKKDLNNSLKILTPPGAIILHDTDPARKELLDDGYCSDAYKILRDLRNNNRVDFITLPMNEAGLTIVKFRNSERHLEVV